MSNLRLRSIGTILSSYSWNGSKGNAGNIVYHGDIEKKGYLVKQKNNKSRFFVLRRETRKDSPARLEYYASEKNFFAGFLPKKTYILNRCFNISRKIDKKNHVIALYINKSCVGLVAKNEEELTEWLQLLQLHKNASSDDEVKAPRKDYEYVLQVKVLPRDLGAIHNLTGHHWLCYSDRSLSLVRIDNPEMKKDFVLSSVRKCFSRDAKFFLQMGTISATGRGMLIFQTENPFTAKKIHSIIGSAMNNRRRITRVNETNKKPPANSRNEARQSNSCPNERPIASSLKRKPNSFVTVRQTHSDGDASSFSRPDDDFRDYAVKYDGYLPMKISMGERMLREYWKHFKKSDDLDGGYTAMDCGEKPERPCTLSLSPTTEVTSLGSYNPLFGTPVSACSGNSFSQQFSLTSSEDSHSMRLSSFDDVYVPMESPVTPAPSPSQSAAGAFSPYLNMGRVPIQFAATAPAQFEPEKRSLGCAGPVNKGDDENASGSSS